MEAQPGQLTEVGALEDRFQLATYKKMPIVAERGKGFWLYASDGQKYLDLYGGHAVAGTGHSHPHVVAAVLPHRHLAVRRIPRCHQGDRVHRC